jgi:hypothetical protein
VRRFPGHKEEETVAYPSSHLEYRVAISCRH